MDIDVSLVSEDKLRLVLKEESVSSRTETIEWDVSEPPYDLFSQVGKCLLDGGDWRISGAVPIRVSEGTPVDSEFLELCWCDTEFENTGKLLSLVDPNLRKSIHTLFDGFKGSALQSIADPIVEAITPYGDWEDVHDRFGEPSGVAWWQEVSDTLVQEQASEAERLAEAEKERLEREYGDPDLVGDFEKLIEAFGENIPEGYLLHLTKFDAPAPGDISDTFLLAWGKSKKPVPSGSGALSARIGGVSFSDGDLAFAHWLLRSRKNEKLARIRDSNNEHAKEALKK
jgi:hypothetical protein